MPARLAAAALMSLAASASAGERLSIVETLDCTSWSRDLRTEGFEVDRRSAAPEALRALRRDLGLSDEARPFGAVAGYLLDGPIPAEAIRLLLRERPPGRALRLPEEGGDILLVDHAGEIEIYLGADPSMSCGEIGPGV